MRPRKSKDIVKTLTKKGFAGTKDSHHRFFNLVIDGQTEAIHTYISHGSKEYDSSLMDSIKKQLKFRTPEMAEKFFDCPMSAKEYVEMLREDGNL